MSMAIAQQNKATTTDLDYPQLCIEVIFSIFYVDRDIY